MIFNDEIEESIEKENQLLKKLLKLNRPVEKEWEDYLCCRGFPLEFIYRIRIFIKKTFNMLARVIEKEVSLIRLFRSDIRSAIFRVLMFFALQKPGEIFEGKLANNIGISSALVKDILAILEKTHLIFHVKPYAESIGKFIRKAWNIICFIQ